MNDLVNLAIGDAALIGVLGYLVVFLGLILLMIVVFILSKIMIAKSAKAAKAAVVEPVAAEPVKVAPAPGSAGALKLYDTDPKDAAIIMAIVADSLGKPLNELRFKSIKEVKE